MGDAEEEAPPPAAVAKPKMPERIEPPEYIAIQTSLVPFFGDITDEQRDR